MTYYTGNVDLGFLHLEPIGPAEPAKGRKCSNYRCGFHTEPGEEQCNVCLEDELPEHLDRAPSHRPAQ